MRRLRHGAAFRRRALGVIECLRGGQYGRRMTTAFITHGDCVRHINPPGHPERAERLEAVWGALEAEEFAYLVRVEAPLATDAMIDRLLEELQRVAV